MPKPRFRFVDDGDTTSSADAQFWRDAEASRRLGSRFKANLFLRALCHSRAWEGAASDRDPAACATTERRLLGEVLARGFGVFGPDLDRTTPAWADAG